MKRQINGLRAADRSVVDRTPDDIFLVRVQRLQFRRSAPKAYYTVVLIVVEPPRLAGNVLSVQPPLLQSEDLVEAELVSA